MTLATVLAEGRQASLLKLVGRLATHPIIVGILAGAACRPVAGFMPAPALQVVDLIGSAAVPCSLISMGVALRRYGLP
jgi:hypothetical protein